MCNLKLSLLNVIIIEKDKIGINKGYLEPRKVENTIPIKISTPLGDRKLYWHTKAMYELDRLRIFLFFIMRYC